MPTGKYFRSKALKRKMFKSHQKGWVSSYKTSKPLTCPNKSWTKWGGSNEGLSLIDTEWTCQSCGERQTDHLPSYLVKVTENEMARICSVCYHQSLVEHIYNIFDLIYNLRPIMFCL